MFSPTEASKAMKTSRNAVSRKKYLSILPFPWYHSSHSALGVFNIAFIAWNQMNMHMKNTLPSGFADIDTDIETVRMKTLGEKFLAMVHQKP